MKIEELLKIAHSDSPFDPNQPVTLDSDELHELAAHNLQPLLLRQQISQLRESIQKKCETLPRTSPLEATLPRQQRKIDDLKRQLQDLKKKLDHPAAFQKRKILDDEADEPEILREKIGKLHEKLVLRIKIINDEAQLINLQQQEKALKSHPLSIIFNAFLETLKTAKIKVLVIPQLVGRDLPSPLAPRDPWGWNDLTDHAQQLRDAYDEICKQILEALADNPSITTLQLPTIQLSEQMLAQLSSFIAKNHAIQLVIINGDSNLGFYPFPTLLAAIFANPNLPRVKFADQEITTELFEYLRQLKQHSFSGKFVVNIAPQHFESPKKTVSEQALIEVLGLMADPSCAVQIFTLALPTTARDTDEILKRTLLLLSKPSLESLTLQCEAESTSTQYHYRDWTKTDYQYRIQYSPQTGMGTLYAVIDPLALMLARPEPLRSLTVTDIYQPQEVARLLLQIAKCEYLYELRLCNVAINSSELYQSLRETLSNLRFLTILELSNCLITNEGIREIASALPSCSCISTLILDYNLIGAEGFESVQRLPKTCPNLQLLSLRYNFTLTPAARTPLATIHRSINGVSSLASTGCVNSLTERDWHHFITSLMHWSPKEHGYVPLTHLNKLRWSKIPSYAYDHSDLSSTLERRMTLVTTIMTAVTNRWFAEIQANNTTALSHLCSPQKLSLYTTNDDGNTALHVAVLYQALDVLDYLLARMHPYTRNPKAQTARELAQSILDQTTDERKKSKLIQIIEKLAHAEQHPCIERPGAIASEPSAPPAKKARFSEQKTKITEWFKPTTAPPAPASASSSAPVTSLPTALVLQLLTAAENNQVALIADIFSTHPNPKTLFLPRNAHGQNIVHLAAQNGDTEMLGFLTVQEGFDPDVQDHEDATPLNLCCANFLRQKSNLDCIQILLTNGAKPNLADHLQRTPLIWLYGGFSSKPLEPAQEKASVAAARLLINAGAEVNCHYHHPLCDLTISLLHQATAIRVYRLMRVLLECADFEPNFPDEHQNTALHWAVLRYDEKAVELLTTYPQVRLDLPNNQQLHACALAGTLLLQAADTIESDTRTALEKIKQRLQEKLETPTVGCAATMQTVAFSTLKNLVDTAVLSRRPPQLLQNDWIHEALATNVAKALEEAKKAAQEKNEEQDYVGNIACFELQIIVSETSAQPPEHAEKRRHIIRVNLAEKARQETQKIVPFKYRIELARLMSLAPSDFLATASDQPSDGTLLKPEVAAQLTWEEFPRLFHHSEQRFLLWLGDEETQQWIMQQIDSNLKALNLTDYHHLRISRIILSGHSFFPVCLNCQASFFGIQNPKSYFMENFSQKLKTLGFNQGTKPINFVTTITTTKQPKNIPSSPAPEIAPLPTLVYSKKHGGALFFAPTQPDDLQQFPFSSRGQRTVAR